MIAGQTTDILFSVLVGIIDHSRHNGSTTSDPYCAAVL
jgi:hypothetical protein